MDKVRGGSLRTQFFAAVSLTLAAAAAASALTVWGCWRLRKWLVPDVRQVWVDLGVVSGDTGEPLLHNGFRVDLDAPEVPALILRRPGEDLLDGCDGAEVRISVERLDYGIDRNGPRREAAYIAAGAAMGVLPAVYAVAGTALCALWFYRRRLAPAISVLDGAAERIREQDLDFTVDSPVNNELGRLCESFESMRRVLYDSNLRLWRALEERRSTTASVAHDLRNPLAILEGLTEHLRETAASGELTGEELESALDDLMSTAKRMERYTDFIRDLDDAQEVQIEPTPVDLTGLLHQAAGSVSVLAESRGLLVDVSYDVPERTVALDSQVFYRALENVFSNAARYAVSRIGLSFALRRDTLTVRVEDDGPGFSQGMLRRKNSLYYTEELTGGHMGLGLATSRILCEKHGGGISISNRPEGGACVELTLSVSG